jgi:cell division protein FtsL
MAKKRGLKVGGWMIAGGLVGFVLIAAAVVARRSYGHREGSTITALQKKEADLESEKTRLSALIRDGSSRSRIVPLAENRLGMHAPSETQIVYLHRSGKTVAH